MTITSTTQILGYDIFVGDLDKINSSEDSSTSHYCSQFGGTSVQSQHVGPRERIKRIEFR